MLPYAYSQLQQAAINYHQQQQQRLFVSAGGGLEGLRLAAPYVVSGGFVGLDPGGYRAFDPRTARFVQEEPKPQHSYIGLIAMAILSNAEKKMVLSDIYQWILDNYPYFRSRGPGWRNSIRHNLSLNDCFVKAGRSANGKGHYWAVHPANVDDFKKGDFRRRRAQRKVRRHMGLSVPNEDDDSDDSPCPSPSAAHRRAPFFTAAPRSALPAPRFAPTVVADDVGGGIRGVDETVRTASGGSPTTSVDEQPCAAAVPPKKRVFDMESLLAPERGKKSSSAESPVNSDSGSASSSVTNCQSMLSADFRSAATSAFLSPITATHWPFHATPYMPTAFCPTGPWFVRALPSPPAVVNGFVAEEAASSRGVDEDGPCASPNSNSAAKWQETFAKIMARSYQGRNLSKSSPSEHNADEDST